MKITMYELLGLVKDGKAPNKIKYRDEIYIMDDLEYFYCKSENRTPLFEYIFDNYNDYDALNEEIIILDNLEEEKKIPEKLDIRQEKNIKDNWKWKVYGKEHSYNISTPQKIIADKLNEVIDYLKSKGENNDI